jgi:simple sugar transport system permease protein
MTVAAVAGGGRFKRLFARAGWGLAAPVLAVIVALLIASLALWLSHNNPFDAFSQMYQYGACNRADTSQPCTADSIESIVNRAIPLYLSGVAVAIGFKMALFNIGVDGQYRLAAVVAAGVAAGLHLPAPIDVFVVLVVAVAVGALWASIAGALKVTRGVSEVISTIMLNAIATGLAAYLLQHTFRQPGQGNVVTTYPIPHNGRFPVAHGFYLFGFVALLVGIGYHFLISRTTFGFELRATGLNPFAALASGVNPRGMVMRTMMLSGAIAGLVGMPDLLSGTYAYTTDFPSDYGFNGIAVALLGRNHPVGVGIGALLFGFLDRSAQILDLNGIPKEIVEIMKGAIVLSVVVAYQVVHRAQRTRAERLISQRARDERTMREVPA